MIWPDLTQVGPRWFPTKPNSTIQSSPIYLSRPQSHYFDLLRSNQSSIEVEYCSLASTTTELSWFHILLEYLGFVLHHMLQIYFDNASTLSSASNPVFRAQTEVASNLVFHVQNKHIEVDYRSFERRLSIRISS